MHATPRFLALSLLSAALLSACGGDSSAPAGGGGGGGGSTTTLTVSPSLGKIFNAGIEVRCLASGAVIGSGSTGATGSTAVALTASCSGPVIVEVVGNGGSSYFDENLNTTAPFTSGALRTVLASVSGAALNVAVTPLTEIATRQALQAAGGSESALTATQINTANNAVVAQVFGAGAAALDILQPPRLWDSSLSSGALANTAADRYALLLAALAGVGSGATPALAVTNALATDLADGVLSGSGAADATYTSGNFATLRDAALTSFAAYASPALQTALGIDEEVVPGGATDGQLTLPTVLTTLLPASAISGVVGTYTGTHARVTVGSTVTTHDSCSIAIAANGNVTVSANGESITQTIDGGNGDASVVTPTYTDIWTLTAGGAPGSDVASISIDIDRQWMTSASAYVVANTLAFPPTFTRQVECWMPINRAVSSSGATWNSRAGTASANNYPSALVGTYTGTLFSDNGVLAPGGATCTVTLASNGDMTLNTAGVTVPTSLVAKIAGDSDDKAEFTDDLNWVLRAKDVSDPIGNGYESIILQSVGGTLAVTGARKPANVGSAAGWACTSVTKVVAP